MEKHEGYRNNSFDCRQSSEIGRMGPIDGLKRVGCLERKQAKHSEMDGSSVLSSWEVKGHRYLSYLESQECRTSTSFLRYEAL